MRVISNVKPLLIIMVFLSVISTEADSMQVGKENKQIPSPALKPEAIINLEYASNPQISPDGKKIAYLGYDNKYRIHQVTQLYLMNSDGTEIRELTPKLDRDVFSPYWASDGKCLQNRARPR